MQLKCWYIAKKKQAQPSDWTLEPPGYNHDEVSLDLTASGADDILTFEGQAELINGNLPFWEERKGDTFRKQVVAFRYLAKQLRSDIHSHWE